MSGFTQLLKSELTHGGFIDPSRIDPGREACPPIERETSDEKIFSAFVRAKSFPLHRIIFQFWRQRAVGGRMVLDCSRSSYAVLIYNLLHAKYRSLCIKYKYSIDNPNANPPWIISGGPVVTAFLNHFPEVIVDLRSYQGSNPLVDCALECGFLCCMMLPIFDHDSRCIIGVVECSMKHHALLLPIFNDLKRELEKEGLSIYHVPGPYKAISGDWETAKTEIENGLKIACESHHLTLGQVWVSYDSDENDDQMKLVKLSSYFGNVDSDMSSFKEFYDTFDVIFLKKGEGLVGRTLETQQSHFCRDVYKLSDNKEGVLALLYANNKSVYTCLVICLRSTHTGELEYAFEFFWPCNRQYILETLILTLRKYLPSFKFAYGDQLGDLLTVVDVKKSSSEALNETNADDDVAIFAAYRHEASLFYLPSSSTFENIMNKLNNVFQLDPARTYKVEYQASPSRWSSLVSLESCRRIDDMGAIKLRLQAEGRQVGWQWKTNS
ncbi:hypothetical protein QVD17_20593 [Tagetes erecta]|uniref:NLP1-9 GAF domain-containing protein n=1 Tax=Tagetes erecta TaxID=13708 RepID=A0AAD8KT45_TARER|nr:hypothetical protein QVD17_20593 [Tagetes erecta]